MSSKSTIKPKRREPVRKPKPAYMTVNKLGEICLANHSRFRNILHLLKYPFETGGYAASGYDEAKAAIAQYFVLGFDESILQDSIKSYTERAKAATSDTMKTRYLCAIEYLKAVIESKSIDKTLEYSIYSGPTIRMNIKGLPINVTPDLIVKKVVRGVTYIGVVRFHLSKNVKKPNEVAEYVACILQRYTQEHLLKDGEQTRPEVNFSYEVYHGHFVSAPKHTLRMFSVIEDTCVNILALWGSI